MSKESFPGFGTVEEIDSRTGYPMDKKGHLLEPSDAEGLIEGWNVPGMMLRNLTNPSSYGRYVVGSKDGFFVCYDFRVIESLVYGKKEWFPGKSRFSHLWVILHATYNTTMDYLIDAAYEVMPVEAENPSPTEAAKNGIALAFEDMKHNEKHWNQDVYSFTRDVALSVLVARGHEVPRFSEREIRFGGKRINGFIKKMTGVSVG